MCQWTAEEKSHESVSKTCRVDKESKKKKTPDQPEHQSTKSDEGAGLSRAARERNAKRNIKSWADESGNGRRPMTIGLFPQLPLHPLVPFCSSGGPCSTETVSDNWGSLESRTPYVAQVFRTTYDVRRIYRVHQGLTRT